MAFARYFFALAIMILFAKAQNLANNELSLEVCRKADSARCKATIAYLKKSCKQRGGHSCGALGFLYESGLGVGADAKLALSFYERACDLNTSFACVNAGAMYAKAKKYDDASSYFSRACKLRDADGCFNAGVAHLYGQGAMESEFLAKMHFNDAIELYDERCDRRDASACAILANIYNDGIATEANAQKSQIFLQKACEIEARFCK